MNDEDELDSSAGSFSSRSSPRSFDMPGGALSSLSSLSSSSSGVIVRCSLLLVRLSSRLALLASCLSCGLSSGVSAVSDCYPFRSFRPIVVSFGSPLVRQVGRGDGVLCLCLGSPRPLLSVACCLPWLGRGCGVAVFLSWVLLVAAVSMASAVYVISVVPVACRGLFYRSGVSRSPLLFASPLVVVVGRHGLIVIGRCRRGSVLSSVIVARRRPALLALECHRRSCSPHGASAVNRFAAHPVSPRLACREAGRRAVRVLSRPVRLVAWGVVLLTPFGSRGGGSFLRCGSCPDTHFAPPLVLRGGAIFFLPLRAANRRGMRAYNRS